MLDDDYLLTFTDTSGLDYADKLHEADPDEARSLLTQHGEAFRQHLVIAKLLEEQADDLERLDADKTYGKIELRGYKSALRHSVADLRSGEFIPPDGGRYLRI